MDLKETKWKSVDYAHVVQDTVKCKAVVNTLTNLPIQ
jgi:hypothetical protein